MTSVRSTLVWWIVAPALSAVLACFAIWTSVAPAQAETNEKQSKDTQKLNTAYWDVTLRIADLDLRKAQELNRRVAGTISANEIERMSDVVNVARRQLDLAKSSDENSGKLYLAWAEGRLAADQRNLVAIEAAVRMQPTAIDPLDVERLKLIVEQDQLAVERAKAVAASGTPNDDMQFEIEQLREEILRLRNQLEAIFSRR